MLAQDAAPAENVAGHLLHVEPASDGQVVETLRKAAAISLARGAPEQAVSYLLRAGAEPPAPEIRGALLHDLGAAELAAGSGDPIAHLQESLAITAPEARPAVAETLAVAFAGAGRHDDAVEMLMSEIPNASDDAALRLEGAMLSSASMSSRSQAQADRLVSRVAGLAGDTPGERLLLAGAAYYSCLHGGRADEAVGLARRALSDGGLLGGPRIDAPPFWLTAAVVLGAEEFDEHLGYLDEADEETSKQGAALGVPLGLSHRAWNAKQRGRIAEAAELGCDAVRSSLAARWDGGLPYVMSIATLALVERAELDIANAMLEEHGMSGELPPEQFSEMVLIARGALRLAEGRPRDALTDLDEVKLRQDRSGIRSAFGPYAWRPWAAHALAAIEENEDARHVAGEALEIARTWGAPGPLAAALRARAAAEEPDARVPLLQEALDVLEGSQADLERIYALLELGVAKRRMRRQTDARAPLLEALDLAEKLGATLVAERARAELEATGVTRRKRTFLSGVEALTPSERRVADMAAEGMSNPQIAQSLFVTRKTVEKHLANAYGKLGISSREDLPQALG
jgi:DNA-binding CsgD family transcriptional regulator